MLIHFGITPYLVFDGDYLPSKAGTEKERAARRKESKRVGLELLKLGKTSQAHLELQKAVDVTPEMARSLIEELKHHNIQYVVAPYEADSQLIYLERKGIIQGILSEDSDLLVFGAKCLITKLDQYGECVEINRNKFTAVREISLAGWTDADFRRMAILSGCDYLPSIGRMGLKTAYRLLRKHKTAERVIKAAQFDGQFKVPAGYLEAFIQAERTFLYQWVFCPIEKKLVNCTDPTPDINPEELPYIGKCVSPEIAIRVATGDLNPHTKEEIVLPPKDRSYAKPLRRSVENARLAQTPDAKSSKGIDTFFKPRRTPLAELDPNSFTPSPSQRNLLHQPNEGWAASMAPPQRPSPIIRSAPQPSRRAISDSYARTAQTPTTVAHPSKRARLCSDTFSKLSTGKSKFFTSSTPDPSPSVRPAKKKKHNTDFELWSDDSLDEALADLPDLDKVSPSKSSRKLKIFSEKEGKGLAGEEQGTNEVDDVSLSTVDMSQEESTVSGVFTPATSFESSVSDLQEDTTTKDAGEVSSLEIKKFSEKFAYKEGENGVKSPVVPALATIRPQVPFLKAMARTSSAPASSRVLQNLAKSSTSSSTSSPSSSSFSGSHPLKSSTQIEDVDTEEQKEIEKEEPEIEDSEWRAMEAEIVIPGSEIGECLDGNDGASDTIGDRDGVIEKIRESVVVKGSEDLLVPDSEAESEDAESPKVSTKTLDLGRFAFKGC